MYIYIVQLGKGGPFKIGVARNIDTRVKALQTGSHEKLYLLASIEYDTSGAAREMEKKLHDLYKNSRLEGEWFSSRIQLSKADWLFKTDFNKQKEHAYIERVSHAN